MAGIESLTQMLGEDVDTLAGGQYEHRPDKPGYRWVQAKALSANITETPAPLGITVGRWR